MNNIKYLKFVYLYLKNDVILKKKRSKYSTNYNILSMSRTTINFDIFFHKLS